MINAVAKTSASVLITGESGSGKELIAEAIHYRSNRRDKPFHQVNCAALTESIINSELFGHEKGAFTGADTQKIGMFEKANEGTLFLDEIGDIPLQTQVSLLRVLCSRWARRPRTAPNQPSKSLKFKARRICCLSATAISITETACITMCGA